MRVVITLEARFQRTREGYVWTTQPFHHAFWARYLEVFDEVVVVARSTTVGSAAGGSKRVDGPGVTVVGLPNYLGVSQFLRSYDSVRRAIRDVPRADDAVILRVPSALAMVLGSFLRRLRRPYAVEVVADPADTLAGDAIRHPLAPVIRWIFVRQLRSLCAHAVAAAYVTKWTLQSRYPAGRTPPVPASPSNGRLPGVKRSSPRTYSYSDVELSEGFLTPRRAARPPGGLGLVTVGSLEHYHKGTDILIQALARCCRRGLDLRLEIIGDGRRKSELEDLVNRLDLEERVAFLGHIPAGEAVRKALDRANLFVLPSRADGLPRAMLEAMARGLPCIGSTVGGIPELLSPEDLVPPGDIGRLSELIEHVVTDPSRMDAMADRCFATAQEYRLEVLRVPRKEFLSFVRAVMEESIGAASSRTSKPSDR